MIHYINTIIEAVPYLVWVLACVLLAAVFLYLASQDRPKIGEITIVGILCLLGPYIIIPIITLFILFYTVQFIENYWNKEI